MLCTYKVISEDELDVIQLQPTTSEKAAEICHIISANVISFGNIRSSRFYNLLKLIGNYATLDDEIAKLADAIVTRMPLRESTT